MISTLKELSKIYQVMIEYEYKEMHTTEEYEELVGEYIEWDHHSVLEEMLELIDEFEIEVEVVGEGNI